MIKYMVSGKYMVYTLSNNGFIHMEILCITHLRAVGSSPPKVPGPLGHLATAQVRLDPSRAQATAGRAYGVPHRRRQDSMVRWGPFGVTKHG